MDLLTLTILRLLAIAFIAGVVMVVYVLLAREDMKRRATMKKVARATVDEIVYFQTMQKLFVFIDGHFLKGTAIFGPEGEFLGLQTEDAMFIPAEDFEAEQIAQIEAPQSV